MNFSFISPKNCQYGTWGVLQSQFAEQPPFSNAPKYQAMADAIALHGSCQAVTATDERSKTAPFLYPNPVTDFLRVKWEQTSTEELTISVFDITGKLVATSRGQDFIHFENCKPGAYIVRLQAGETYFNKLIVKQ